MKKIAFIFIILAGITWGTSGIFVNLLSPYGFTSPQMTAIRSVVSMIAIGGFLLIRDRGAFKASPKELLLFLGSGLSFFGTATCYYFSMQATSIATAVVLMYTAPVIVMGFSVAFLGERLTRLKGLSVFLMIVGCGLVSGIIGGLRFDPFGILMGMLSGISYSAYNILTKIEMQRKCKPLSATFYNALFASIVSLAVCKPMDIIKCASSEPIITVPLMIALGLVTCVTPYVLYTNALKSLPAETTSALAIVEPMAATFFSIVIYHEQLTPPSAIGMVLILTAVFLLGRSEASAD